MAERNVVEDKKAKNDDEKEDDNLFEFLWFFILFSKIALGGRGGSTVKCLLIYVDLNLMSKIVFCKY